MILVNGKPIEETELRIIDETSYMFELSEIKVKENKENV